MGNLMFMNWCCKRCGNIQLISIPHENGIYDVKCDSCSQVYEIAYVERLKSPSASYSIDKKAQGSTEEVDIPSPFEVGNKGGIVKGPK